MTRDSRSASGSAGERALCQPSRAVQSAESDQYFVAMLRPPNYDFFILTQGSDYQAEKRSNHFVDEGRDRGFVFDRKGIEECTFNLVSRA